MLRRLNHLLDFKIESTAKGSDVIGKVKDVYFDDEKWVERYLVVDTGRCLTGRLVLISLYSVEDIDWDGQVV